MLKFIEKLREKPIKAKKKIALLFAGSFSGLIFLMWILIIYPNFKEGQNREANAVGSELSPFSAFTDMVYSSFLSIGGEATGFKRTIEGLAGSETYVKNDADLEDNIASSTQDI